MSDGRRAEAERELDGPDLSGPDGALGRLAPQRHLQRPRRPADPRRRALARARGRRPGQRRAARPGRRDPALAARQPRQPAPGRGRLVGPLAGHGRGPGPPLRRRAGALPRDHLGAARPARRALAPPRHHPGDLPAHPRRPPPARALLAPRRALGPRLGQGVVVPLALTHRILGQLVGARRPTVSTALAELAERGELVRRPTAPGCSAATRRTRRRSPAARPADRPTWMRPARRFERTAARVPVRRGVATGWSDPETNARRLP